ncbi:MAG: isoprenylcysteine carboxylmethyltransferase family protein [Planctomycetes bacterium]|nr:isoprenylcysteine carboxylmethyltransferase family protein [Planctomycetota bacterium]
MVSIIGLLLMVGGLAGLILTDSILTSNPVAIACQALAVALMIWARITFGSRSFHAAANPTAGGLVTTGPYGLIRHPIYTAVCLFGVACVLSHWSPQSAAFGALLLAGSFARMLCEETLLVKTYPEYIEYMKKVKRMVPHVF